MSQRPTIALAILLAFLLPAAAYAQQRHHPVAAPASAPTTEPGTDMAASATEAGISTTEGQVTVAGSILKYRARAGHLTLRNDADKPIADMFFVSYEKLPAADSPADRPITFVFNGGPGAAAVWLQMGAAGPRRIDLDANGDPPSPPYAIVENPSTWLASTDMVFIDPVGTGFSRAAPGEDPKQFWGVDSDVKSVGDFIRLYTTHFDRWLSPKFVAGESYGTTRAAYLSDQLLGDEGISLNGVILISSVLDFQTLEPSNSNDLPYALYIPSYAAVAWYHKKLAPDLQADLHKTVAAAADWATHDYLAALAAGNSLSHADKSQIAQTLSKYTSLSPDYIMKANLRVGPGEFRKMLLADSQQLIGRFDSRIAGYDPDPLSRSAEYDPSLDPYLAAYSGTFNDYVRRTLKVSDEHPYEVLSGHVGPWNFGPGGGGYLNVSDHLRDAMLSNPHMKVMFCNGYFDLATPFLAADYTINHMNLSPPLRANITHEFFNSGHMVYQPKEGVEKLSKDVQHFIAGAMPNATTRR
jgi:carboxypeptidase C (cathepsin A)